MLLNILDFITAVMTCSVTSYSYCSVHVIPDAVDKACVATNWVNSNISVFAHSVMVAAVVGWSQQQLEEWDHRTVHERHNYDIDWVTQTYDDVRDKTLLTLHSTDDTPLFIVLVNDMLGIPANTSQ